MSSHHVTVSSLLLRETKPDGVSEFFWHNLTPDFSPLTPKKAEPSGFRFINIHLDQNLHYSTTSSLSSSVSFQPSDTAVLPSSTAGSLPACGASLLSLNGFCYTWIYLTFKRPSYWNFHFCVLEYCVILNAQHVISATRGPSIKTVKTKDVVWQCCEVTWDCESFLHCQTANMANENLSNVTQAEMMFMDVVMYWGYCTLSKLRL